MSDLPQTGSPEWAGSEASPWNTQNKINRGLDAFATRSVIESRVSTAPPGTCADGARYMVASGGTGAWSGHDGELAVAVGANASNGWYFYAVAREGNQLYVKDEGQLIEYLLGSWTVSPDRIVTELAGINDGDILYYDLSGGFWYPGAPPSSGSSSFAHQVAASDQSTPLVENASVPAMTFEWPYDSTMSAIHGFVNYAAYSSAIVEVDVHLDGVSVFSTTLTIDPLEKSSRTAATPAVLSGTSWAKGQLVEIFILQPGDGTTGLILTFEGTKSS